MEWARNHVGELVAASEFGSLRWGLTCPSCGEPVNRRAGPERRPHFAHFSNRAKPDCDNYFPSLGTSGTAITGGSFAQRAVASHRAIQAGLFLIRDTERRLVELCLRVPEISGGTEDGVVEIRSGRGSHTYAVAQLVRSRLVPLQPASPAASCVGMGVLVGLAVHLNGAIAEFGNWMNFFAGGENGGRLLVRSEQLEWGETYLVLTPNKLEVPNDASGALQLNAVGRLSNWHVYEAVLASAFASSKSEAWSAVARFLGREIRKGQPRAHLVHPMPHHIDPDGTFVFDTWPEAFIVRTTADAPVTLESGRGTRATHVTRRTGDGFVYLEDLSIRGSEAVLAIGGRDQFVIRREESGLFAPAGATARTRERSWDVVSCPTIGDVDSEHLSLTVECPSARLASYLAKRNPGWRLDEATFSTLGDQQDFWGENFGNILAMKMPLDSVQVREGSEVQKPQGRCQQRAKWIDWLITSQFGREGLAANGSAIGFAGTSNQRGHLGHRAVALLPYLAEQRTSKSRKGGKG